MGLERLVCTLQNCKTNYDTDLFKPIIKKIEELSGVTYTDQKEIRSIADHIKTLTFALSDGACFSNEGRGYVLRRILRRASRFGRNIGIYEPFMYKLTGCVIEIMKDAYPYLIEHKDEVDKLIKKEEITFLRTLELGEKRLNELTLGDKKITGEDVFKLYDTYGFPYELTIEILNEKGIKIDKGEFDKCMQHQRTMAREASKKVSGMNVQGDIINFKDDSIFTGYDKLETKAKVIFVGDLKGNSFDIYSEGIIITDKTPFYATMGGQLGDVGVLTGDGLKAEVFKCEPAPNGQHMHFVRIIEGSIKKGDIVTLVVDKENRFTTCQNHSATHLLQKALKEVLGNEVSQAGSYVDNETLRFDFNYSGKIHDEDVIKVEEKVNEKISANVDTIIKQMNIDDAKKIGATALFNEKYGDVVRVVKLGDSVELCGGTHVTNTGNIRKFAIKSIESKGLNVYRIEAVCDTNLETEIFSVIKPYNDEMILLLKKAKKIIDDALKDEINLDFDANISNERPTCYKDVLENKEEVTNLRKQVADLEKSYKEKLKDKVLKDASSYLDLKVNGKYGEVVILTFDNYDVDTLKQLAGFICSKLKDGIVFITNKKEDSMNFICKSSENLKDVINVGSLIKDVSLIADGNGGGSKTFAQGGGTNKNKLDIIDNYVKDTLINE